MKVTRSLVLLVTAVALNAQQPGSTRPPPPPEQPKSQWVFSLMPKSFQRHPSLDFHVITEMTPAGKQQPEPTTQKPVYYLTQAGKFTQLGNNTPANEKPPAEKDLLQAMQRSLAASNYRAATPSTPLPSIVVVFNYGSFARFSTDADDFQQMIAMDEMYRNMNPDEPAPTFMPGGEERDVDSLLAMVMSNPQDRGDVIKRAELIGGQKFAKEMADALNQEATFRQSAGGAVGVLALASPFHRFMDANQKLMELVEESFSSCYFVVASAYDYVAMRKGQKVLLWRTKMTVNSSGVSMTESLPSLVLSAGPYFGRDMPESVTLTRKISREGKVEVGTPTVVDYLDDTATPPKKK